MLPDPGFASVPRQIGPIRCRHGGVRLLKKPVLRWIAPEEIGGSSHEKWTTGAWQSATATLRFKCLSTQASQIPKGFISMDRHQARWGDR